MKSTKRFIILFFILLIVGIALFTYYKEGTLAVNKSDRTYESFEIDQGESLNTIVKNLEGQGLIRNKLIFVIVIKELGIERKIQAGDFRLSPAMNAYEIANTLTHGTEDKWLTIIEGLRKEEIAAVVSKEFGITEVEFNQLATEGYLFPDTYLLPNGITAERLVKVLKENLYSKLTTDIQNKIKKLDLNENEAITLASLIEREARYDEDRQVVASIMLKRIRNDWPLQIDATVQYALGYQASEKTWWKKSTTFADLEVDSPYNTYKNKGLPPGPICNPGISSILAVAEADPNTQYWFYISDKTGKMHYAKTLEEHNSLIRKYLD